MHLANHIIVSFRQFTRHKAIKFVGIIGLMLGMIVALKTYEYVSFENSYDNIHEQAGNIYRVTTEWNRHTVHGDSRATTVSWSGHGVRDIFPEIMEQTRFTKLAVMSGDKNPTYDGKSISETDIFLADPGFLKIFSFRLLAGDANTALNEPGNIIITRSIADKYFDHEDPINQVIHIDAENLTTREFRITGIMEDPPINSHMKFHFLMAHRAIPAEFVDQDGSMYWHWDLTYSYLLLHPQANPATLARQMTTMRTTLFGKNFGAWSDSITFHLQPLLTIHGESTLAGELSVNGDKRYTDFLSIVGICVLLCACFNFINLSAVDLLERVREMSIRRIIGSSRTQLLLQLLIQNSIAMIAAGAMSLAIILTIDILYPHDGATTFSQRLVNISLLSISGVIVSSVFPLMSIGRINPAVRIRSGMSAAMTVNTKWMRQLLSVTQFTFCFVLVSGTFVLLRQFRFMQEQDLGMNLTQVIGVRGYGFQSYNEYQRFRNELSNINSEMVVGYSSAAPGDEIRDLGLRPTIRIDGDVDSLEVKLMYSDEHYLDVMEMKLAAGRNFNPSLPTDKDVMVVNETTARLLGYQHVDSIVGRSVKFWYGTVKIVGVVRDFHQRTLRNHFEPLVILPAQREMPGWSKRYYYVKLPSIGLNPDEIVSNTKSAWIKSTGQPFEYFFADDRFETGYINEKKFSDLFMQLSAIGVTLALLGVYGMMSFLTLQRTKEIGIRKVLGASVANILKLLSQNFVLLLVMAMILSLPLTWFLAEAWLDRYAFRIDLTPWLFVTPLLAVSMLTLLTVILKSMAIAMSNPVDSIKGE